MPVFRKLISSTFPFVFRYQHCIANVTTRVFPLILSVYKTSLIHPRSISKSESALPTIVVPEAPVLVDKRIAIRVLNLHSFQRVTVRVHAAQTNRSTICFESYGHFIADIYGNVDIAKDASFGGTYKGVDGMGLFWSMLPVPGQRKGIRWVTRDVTKPMHFFVAVFDGHVMSNEKAANPSEAVAALPLPLANATILRTYLSDDIERREISVRNIRGTLFLPKERRRFPGVIDMFGSNGGLLEFRAAILASYGYVVLALAFFGYKDLPTSVRNLDIEYFVDAVEWLASHDRVYQNGIGIIGVSFGGQIALQLAAKCPMVAATVAISSPNIFLTPVKYQSKSFGLQRNPCIDDLTLVDERTIVSRDFFDLDSSESEQLEIPVEKIRGEVLVISGSEDGCYNSSKMAARMQKRLALHKRPSLKTLDYPGTGHLIEVPFMPMCKISFYKYYYVYILWGGDVEAHSAAQEHAWQAIRDFLNEHI